MDKREKDFLKIVLSVFPAWSATQQMNEAVLFGGLAAVFFWTSVSFFHLTRKIFPTRWIKTAFILWIATLAQIEFLFSGMPPYWALSVILLMPEETWKGALSGNWSKRIFLQGGIFWLLVIYLGVAQEWLGQRLLIHTFRMPTGFFILLGIAAFAWKLQPAREKGNSA